MNKFVKRTMLAVPPIKRRYEELVNLRKDNEQLRLQISHLSSHINRFNNTYDDLVDSLWNNDKRDKWTCTAPFENMLIYPKGEIGVCCGKYLTPQMLIIGNALTNSFDSVWNSDKLKRLRYSVSMGNFEYCKKKCHGIVNPKIFASTIERNYDNYNYAKWQDCSLDTSPTKIQLWIDDTCNLRCASCRNHLRVKTNAECEQIATILENFVRPAIKNCTEIMALGSGEFFASKPTVNFFKTLSKSEFPQLKIVIQTNAILLTPKKWDELSNLKGMVGRVRVSCDGAKKETYEKLRGGASWEIFCENMEYISSLRSSGEIDDLVLAFVVQKDNYSEIVDFVLLAKKWRVDKLSFMVLENYGTYTESEYNDKNVLLPENAFYEEAARTLKRMEKENTDIVFFIEGF